MRSGRSKDLEIIVLRQQLKVLRRQFDRPELNDDDRNLLGAVADALLRAHRDGVINVAVLKFNATGGVGEHRFLARLGLELEIPMRIEDFFGTGITLAAVTHIAHTFPAGRPSASTTTTCQLYRSFATHCRSSTA